MSKNHDSSSAQPPGSTSQGKFRPPGAVSLFGANPGLLGEMKARLRGNDGHSNDGSDSDTRSSPPLEKSSPMKIRLDSKGSSSNKDPHSFPKHATKEKLPALHMIDVDHPAPHTRIPATRRNPGSPDEDRVQPRNPSRTQSMYATNPNAHLADVLRHNPISDSASVSSTTASPISMWTSSPSPSSTTANTGPLLSSLTSKRARKPRSRPPTVYLMSNVPSTPEQDELLTDDPEQKMLTEFFKTRSAKESPS